MSIVLTIIIAVVLIGFAVWGAFRGVQRGVLTLVGTIMGASLVDLWYVSWAQIIRDWISPESPQFAAWFAATFSFLVVAFIGGYGSSTLLKPSRQPLVVQKISERLLAAALGALNAALIVSYLLRYATQLLQSNDFNSVMQESCLAPILYAWLPWFVLAIVLAVFINIILRALQPLLRSRGIGIALPSFKHSGGKVPNPASKKPVGIPVPGSMRGSSGQASSGGSRPSQQQSSKPLHPDDPRKAILDEINRFDIDDRGQ